MSFFDTFNFAKLTPVFSDDDKEKLKRIEKTLYEKKIKMLDEQNEDDFNEDGIKENYKVDLVILIQDQGYTGGIGPYDVNYDTALSLISKEKGVEKDLLLFLIEKGADIDMVNDKNKLKSEDIIYLLNRDHKKFGKYKKAFKKCRIDMKVIAKILEQTIYHPVDNIILSYM